MLSPDGAVRMIRRHQARLEQFVTGTERRMSGLWVATRGGSQFAPAAAKVATALRTTVANQTAATLAMYVRLTDAEPGDIRPRDIVGEIRNGADPVDTYSQPARARAWTIEQDRSATDADQVARARLRELVATDAALAAQRVEYAFVAATSSVVGWRRVPDPKACLLCLSASQQVYRSQNLRGIHEHCKCGTAPVTRQFDPRRAVAGLVAAQFAAAGREVSDQLHVEVDDPEFGVRLREVSR